MIVIILTIILLVLILLNVGVALMNIYYPKYSIVSCEIQKIKLPMAKKEETHDQHGQLYPSELELNDELLLLSDPTDTFETRAHAKLKPDLINSEKSTSESARESARESAQSVIEKIYPTPIIKKGSIFKFGKSVDAVNRKFHPVPRVTVLNQQERDGYS
jgi:hypothetical protein